MQNIKSIQTKLSKIWKKLYIVWWWCREYILWWKYENDIDLATDASPLEISENLDIKSEIWKKYGTFIIIEWWESFEITSFRSDIWTINNRKPAQVKFTDSLEEDSKRRDFTFNSIYFDLETEVFIDPNNGIDDLKKGIIRFIWNPDDRLEEDVIRILRYIRFKYKYLFKPADTKYFELLKSKIYLLKNISIERIRKELDDILIWNNNIEALKDLKAIWFFENIIPEIDDLERCPGGPRWHLEWNVWIHTLMTIKELNKMNKWVNKQWFYSLDSSKYDISKQELVIFYRIMLLHDIAKLDCFSRDDDGCVHYYGHEELWSSIFKKSLSKRLKFSNNEISKITWILENHLNVFRIFKMKKIKAFRLMMNKYWEDLIIVWKADHRGRTPSWEAVVNDLENLYKDFKSKVSHIKFLDGNDIIKKYPDIEWSKISEKLKYENDKILNSLNINL